MHQLLVCLGFVTLLLPQLLKHLFFCIPDQKEREFFLFVIIARR